MAQRLLLTAAVFNVLACCCTLTWAGRDLQSLQQVASLSARSHHRHHLQGLGAAVLSWLPEEAELEVLWPHHSVHQHIQPALKFYGQDEEDVYAWEHYFFGITNGTYLEMGALDGVLYSNTLFFNEQLNWKGLLIEPSPESFASLIQNRKGDVCVNAAVCAENQLVHFMSGKAEFSTVNGIWEFMTEPFRQQWYPGRTNADDVPTIPCVPLMQLLAKFGLWRIDFFSLDVEGAELEVLKVINFDQVSIGVIVMEASGDYQREAEINERLTRAGFKNQGTFRRNTWFVHQLFPVSSKA